MDREERLRAIRALIVELVVYGALVTLYAVSVLQLLVDPLADFYDNNRAVYAGLALVLIVAQGVFLERITSFLMDRLRLVRFD